MCVKFYFAPLLFMTFILCACSQGRVSEAIATTSRPSPGRSSQREAPTDLPIPTTTIQANLPDMEKEGCSGSVGAPAPSARIVLGPSEGIPASTAEAESLVLKGTLFYRNCIPIPGATMELWQTDGEGVYGPGHGSDDMQCCYFQGTVQADSNGRFEITTVYPGYYQGEAYPPPAHIHVSIQLPGREPGGRAIDTEIVFAGDPHLPPNASSPAFTIVAVEKIQAAGAETWFGEVNISLGVDPP